MEIKILHDRKRRTYERHDKKNDEFWQRNFKVSFMLPESLIRNGVPVTDDEDGFVTNDNEQSKKF